MKLLAGQVVNSYLLKGENSIILKYQLQGRMQDLS